MVPQADQVQNEKSYKKIARLYHLIYDKGLSKQRIIESILESEGDINYLIPENNYFKYKKPEFIGSTILHLVVQRDDFETAITLIKNGADFTIKNIKGNTALHIAIENVYQKSKKSYKLQCELAKPFINSVLSLYIQAYNSENPCNEFGLSHFHIACMMNNASAMRFFLKNGVSVNERVNMNSPLLPGYTPMHFIAKYGNLDTMKILFDHGVDVNLVDAKKINPLQVLIERNLKTCELKNMDDEESCQELKEDIEEYEKMINFYLYHREYVDEDINQQDSISATGLSYLHIACNFQSHTIVETLLEQNLDLETCVSIDSPLWPGYTALHFAACCNINTVKLLLNKGANISSKDAKGVTPLDLCLRQFLKDVGSTIRCQENWKDIVFSDGQTILSDFIDTFSKNPYFYDYVVRIDVDIFVPFNSPLWPGYTPLHLIVLLKPKSDETLDSYDDIKKVYSELYERKNNQNQRWNAMLETLLGMNADVTIQDVNGSTPLHLTFELGRRDMAIQMVRYHEKTINPVNKDGLSHLHIACASFHQGLVEILLRNGADVNAQVKISYGGLGGEDELLFSPGSTPLHMTIIMNDEEIVRLLLANGADFTIQDVHGLTPIHYFLNLDYLSEDYEEIFTSLDLSQDCVSNFGLSYLHIASYMDDADLIEKLLDTGANIEETIKLDSVTGKLSSFAKFNDYTPLHLAMKQLNTSAMEVLISHSADPFAKLPDGSLPLYNVFKLEPRRAYEEGNAEAEDELISTLFDFEAVQQRVEEETGITALHIACCVVNVDKVKEALEGGVDANVRVKSNSPVWPNSTPIQVLCTNRDYFSEELSEIIELLVNHGADVTLQNGNLESPIHGMESLCGHGVQFTQLDLAFKAQRDFSVNPTNANGLSHFHLACYNNQLAMVEEFLKQGVDVNSFTDYFDSGQGGYTPLHFASNNHFKEMIKLLLSHGADVHAQDYNGDTPLHATTSLIDFDEETYTILIDAGADVNAKNLYGQTPFQLLLDTRNVESKVINFFLERGSSINLFNATSQEGYIAIGLSMKGDENFEEKAIFKELMDHPSKYQLDDVGRTPIHNVVSIDTEYRSLRRQQIALENYIKIISCLTSANFDINYQDNKGQTALHYAVHFGNYKGVIGLLKNGADVNIADEKDLPPLAYAKKYKVKGAKSHQRVVCELSKHLYKLQCYGIYVSEKNKEIFAELYEENKLDYIREDFYFDERRIEKNEIDSYYITDYDFLSDTGAVAAYPRMLPDSRELIDRYFQENNDLHRKYPHLAEVLKLQYNKALARVNLLQCARSSLKTLVNFEFPDVCVDAILRFMGNHELQKIISMTHLEEPSRKRRKLG